MAYASLDSGARPSAFGPIPWLGQWAGACWLRSPCRMPDPDEAKLLDAARRGDRTAFGALVRKHQRRVYACALSMLADAGEAEDAVQETFLRAYRAIARFDGRSELSTWLYRICVNVCLNTIRRRRRVQAADIADPRVPEPAADETQNGVHPAADAETREMQRRLARALDKLSPTLRTTVVLVLVQGLPHKEVSKVLGCPEGTIAWRIHEARRKLRQIMLEQEPAEKPSSDADERPSDDAEAAGREAS